MRANRCCRLRLDWVVRLGAARKFTSQFCLVLRLQLLQIPGRDDVTEGACRGKAVAAGDSLEVRSLLLLLYGSIESRLDTGYNEDSAPVK